eukprot:TRINITY_DN56222_c0_g1_i1.p1 TRINITY_DN56222_c0_g1~~TRINITY_DN56222_c0_g1_i1.p1  ORF type:complete len:353 (-),score=45.01 TRINITY_DN56222_c0_g1_i1:57-1115(-)
MAQGCDMAGAKRSCRGHVPPSKTVKIAFIGAGDISTLHAEGVRKCEDAELVGLWNYKEVDRTAGGVEFSASQRAKEYGCKQYRSLEELLADSDLDAVYVLTNMESHHLFVMRALEAGKHVVVEKPVGSTVAEILEMKERAEKRGLVCMPGHNYIYEPQVLRMRETIESGAIGRVVQLHVFYNIKHVEAVAKMYPGVIRQIMTHHAYVTLYLMGETPSLISGMKATINDGSVPQENLAMIMMQMSSGAISTMQTSFANDDHTSEPWSFYVKVLGTEGGARYSYNDFVDYRKHIVHSHTYLAYPHTVKSVSDYFVQECLKRGKQPLSTMEDAATCLRILEAAERSIEEGVHVRL